MLRTCDRCGIGDDFYMMYYAHNNKSGDVNVICDECAMNHKDEYTDITSVHTMSKNVVNEVHNKFTLMGNVKRG